MTRSHEVTIVGGSSAFLPALAAAFVARASDLPYATFRLLGRDLARTRLIADFCGRLARRAGVDHRYVAHDQLDSALDGVDVVLFQPRVGGYAGRSHDETFPLSHGYPGDEGIGPGGLASAVRTAPVLRQVDAAMKRRCPDAWLVCLSNPMSILLHVLSARGDRRLLGLCELPQRTLEKVASCLSVSEVEGDYLGINHQGWFLRLDDGAPDTFERLLQRIERDGVDWFGVDVARMREHGALPLRYLRLYEHRWREVDRARVARQRGHDRGRDLASLARRLTDHYSDPAAETIPAELRDREMPWNELAVAPAVIALLGGPAADLYVSEPNRGHYGCLAEDAIVEKRCRVDAIGVHPSAPGEVVRTASERFPHLVSTLRRIAKFEAAAARAAETCAPRDVVAALRIHPWGIDALAAEAMAPEVLTVPVAAGTRGQP